MFGRFYSIGRLCYCTNYHELQLLLQYSLHLFGCGVNGKDGPVAVNKHGDATGSANAIFLPNLMFILQLQQIEPWVTIACKGTLHILTFAFASHTYNRETTLLVFLVEVMLSVSPRQSTTTFMAQTIAPALQVQQNILQPPLWK